MSEPDFEHSPSEEVSRAACERVVEAAGGLWPIWEQHLADNEGEVLAHVFFGDVARYFAGWVDHATAKERAAFLDAIEELAASPGPLENLINVSFVEHFAWGTEDEQALLDRYWSEFGPATQRAVVAVRNYPSSLDWSDTDLEQRTEVERRARRVTPRPQTAADAN